MNQNTAEEFGRTIRNKGRFLFIPKSASEGLLARTLGEVECLGLPGPYDHKRWEEFPSVAKEVIVRFLKFRLREGTLPEPDLNDSFQWKELYKSFRLDRKDGYLLLPDHWMIEFLSTPIHFGTLHAPAGCAHTDYHFESGHLVTLKRSFSKTRVTRLMRLTREHLHQVQRNDPAKIVEIAGQLGLLK